MKERKIVIIMGAGGRDFHNFNIYFKNNPDYEVVAFTQTQIPEIEGRIYPKELAGDLYPEGIPLYSEKELVNLIKEKNVSLVVFSYSDVDYDYVMKRAEMAMSAGASFMLLGPKDTMLESKKPVIAICAVRTGAGKSPLTRKICEILKKKNINFCVVRHPMAYGDFKRQAIQKFEKMEDLDYYQATIEEREEYEPHIKMGNTVFAGVDYKEILRKAEEEFSLIVWDGGNNDFPFFKPNLLFVVCDPLRAGDEISYHPGFALFQMADVLCISKVSSAKKEQIKILKDNIEKYNKDAEIILADLVPKLKEENIKIKRGKKAIVVEDGPTTTHGNMPYGAGYLYAKKLGLKIIEPEKYAYGIYKKIYKEYPHLKYVVPAIGYRENQIFDLKRTLERAKVDYIISATPIDLNRVIKVDKPIIHIEYYFQEKTKKLEKILDSFLKSSNLS
ncbi:MAG: GTPase [candidate division WOR-3 bacterium]